jgi:hypothetical protein
MGADPRPGERPAAARRNSCKTLEFLRILAHPVGVGRFFDRYLARRRDRRLARVLEQRARGALDQRAAAAARMTEDLRRPS